MRRAVILRGRGRGRRAAFVHPGGAEAGRPSQHASWETAAGTSRLEGLGGGDGVAVRADGGRGIWCTGWGRAGTAGGNGGDGGMRAAGSPGEGQWGTAGAWWTPSIGTYRLVEIILVIFLNHFSSYFQKP
jgi:hypothetical protein